MTGVEGIITTTHENPSCVAAAVRVDNISGITTEIAGDLVRTRFLGTRLRSIIASADDYLMNLAIADEACRLRPAAGGSRVRRKGLKARKTKIKNKER